MKRIYFEKELIEIFSCGHGKNIKESNCSFCKSRMMKMPKRKVKVVKTKDQHIDWSK